MDVYDFDGTLYMGDSTRDFTLWCMRRYPRVALTMPRTGIAALRCFGLHSIDKTEFKGALYRFLKHVPYIEAEIELFWHAHEHKITGPCHAQPGDLVISASPVFLLQRPCEARGLELIASEVDPYTGQTLGPNCSGAEKVTRFRELYPNAEIDGFYSDSHIDDPLAHMAKRAFLVRGGALRSWN